MDGLVVIGILLLGGFLISVQKNKGAAGMQDDPVSLNNIRRGVANGWYTCTLTRVDGEPAVRLTGKTVVGGKQYTDVYPISETDWQTLRAEGYEEI